MFLDVGFDGQKILMDKASSLLVFIGLGLQPSTAPSAGSCAKVQQNRSILLLGRGKRLINVLAPIYGHKLATSSWSQIGKPMRTTATNSIPRLGHLEDHLAMGFARLHKLLRISRLLQRNGLR
jgi:hypothetical protein